MLQVVVDTFNQRIDSAQHRQGWEGSVSDVLALIQGKHALYADGSARTVLSTTNQFVELLCLLCWLSFTEFAYNVHIHRTAQTWHDLEHCSIMYCL